MNDEIRDLTGITVGCVTGLGPLITLTMWAEGVVTPIEAVLLTCAFPLIGLLSAGWGMMSYKLGIKTMDLMEEHT